VEQGLEALAEGIQGSASLTHLDLESKVPHPQCFTTCNSRPLGRRD
jgi:hypothetical protein